MKNFILSLFLVCSHVLFSQAPVNDQCGNADEIIIAGNGYGYGTFISGIYEVEKATRQSGEQCFKELDNVGNCSKTLWYKFYIPTTRNVSIKLTQQDSAIPQIYAGYNIYSVKDCNYSLSDLIFNLTPMNKFGISGNYCLGKGWYYIQVGCHTKAKGKLWIELLSQAPAAPAYDSHTKPGDIGLVKDRSGYVVLLTECTSVDKGEYTGASDSSITRSVFAKFTLPANSMSNAIYLISNTQRIRYRCFKDTITTDSVNSSKPFMSVYDSTGFGYTFLSGLCRPEFAKQQKYFFQFITEEQGETWFYVRVDNQTYQPDLWSTPATDDIIYTNNNYSRSKKHNFTCDGMFDRHGCKTVIPKFITHSYETWPGQIQIDTFGIAGYTVINSSETGTVNVRSKDAGAYDQGMYYLVYKGDITKGCNLTFIRKSLSQSFNFCVNSGTYTLITLRNTKYGLTEINQVIRQYDPQVNVKYYYPKTAENMGTYNPQTTAVQFSSRSHFYQARDTSITVDTFTVKGYLMYREVYFSKAGLAWFYDTNYVTSRYYMFKGRISKGQISLLKNHSYIKGQSCHPLGGNCPRYDTGYYTIISRMDTIYKEPDCAAPSSMVRLNNMIGCLKDSFYHPQSAYPVNGNNDVLSATANKVNMDYIFTLPGCTECVDKSAMPALPYYRRIDITPNALCLFYTFYLGQNAEFRIYPGYSMFELYKGNCISNPGIIYDTANIVSYCKEGTMYCNLEGGRYYTLAMFTAAGLSPNKLYFTPHIVSVNDYANKAYDLGHFNSNKTVSSTPVPITCHTGSAGTDPCSYMYDFRECPFDWTPNLQVPYKDTLNMKRMQSRKNLWYTFTVEKTSRVHIRLSATTSLSRVRQMNLFKYKGVYRQNTSQALSIDFDSTENKMEWMNTNNYLNGSSQNREDTFSIVNAGCEPVRYFLLVEDDYAEVDPAHYQYVVTLQYSQITLQMNGDNCSDAVAGALSTYGSVRLRTDHTCHTWGGSEFEKDTSTQHKSTWFKVSVTQSGVFDLQVKKILGDNIKYYNVYGGDCRSMKKILYLADGTSYFTLTCMGQGDYYIQAVAQSASRGDIEFEMSVLKPGNPNCKPYVFSAPYAQFKAEGLCTSDTLRFINQTTSRVSGIIYSWYINGIKFSSQYSPALYVKSSLVKSVNNVMLIAADTINELADTITQVVQPDTTHYKFEIAGKRYIRCGEQINLTVQTDYKGALSYLWSNNQDTTTGSGQQLTVKNIKQDRLFTLRSEGNQCKFSDTFLLRFNPVTDYFRDTTMCAYEQQILIAKKGALNLTVNGVQITKDSFVAAGPGNYQLTYMLNGCNATETLRVAADSTVKTVFKNDTVTVCNAQQVQLQNPLRNLQSVVWSTGAVTDNISVQSPGMYTMKGYFDKCNLYEYHVLVRMQQLSVDFIRDTTVCLNDRFEIKNPFSDFALVSSVPPPGIKVADNAFTRKMVLKKGLCTVTDSGMVNVFRTANRYTDTFFCDSGGLVSLRLDAGAANFYYWMPGNEQSRTIQVKTYGRFQVQKTYQLACKDTLFFNVSENCPLNVYIPNVFTPNGDLIDDVFVPVMSGSSQIYSMLIYNRWGEQLYETDDGKGWDGYYQGTPVAEGVYVFLIKVRDLKGRVYNFRGTVTILR